VYACIVFVVRCAVVQVRCGTSSQRVVLVTCPMDICLAGLVTTNQAVHAARWLAVQSAQLVSAASVLVSTFLCVLYDSFTVMRETLAYAVFWNGIPLHYVAVFSFTSCWFGVELTRCT